MTQYTYDAKGNVASVTHLYGTADAVTTSFTYEPTYNLLTSTTDPLSHTTSFAYDSQGRLQSATDALSHQTVSGTNAVGQIVSLTDALSKTTEFTYERVAERRLDAQQVAGRSEQTPPRKAVKDARRSVHGTQSSHAG